MPYPAAAIANEFLRLARESNRALSPMKVQKLVYFAHGWYLAFTGKPLLNEPVEAWKFGPVIPSLYQTLKRYGSESVTTPLAEWEWRGLNAQLKECSIDDGPDPAENEQAKRIVKRIWDVYGNFTAVQLSNLTHFEHGPWNQTPNKNRQHTVIDQEKIRQFFFNLLQKNRERQQSQQHA
jgi:uncharacterized phage-associated protein